MEQVSLKELCALVHASRRSIQGYEKAGLMRPTGRNKYGYLLYDKDAVERAGKIQFLHEIGFEIKEIKALIDAPDRILKDALEEKRKELEAENDRLWNLIREVNEYIENLNKKKH